MKSVINKGRHYHRYFPFPIGIYLNKKVMAYKVNFDITCKYDLPGTQDDEDVNKLFGLSFTLNHHKDSARFGWNYNKATNKINIHYYCYVSGERFYGIICEVPLYQDIPLYLTIKKDGYVFECKGYHVFIDHNGVGVWSYRLGDYFGGNMPAPHRIEKTIKKIGYNKSSL